MYSQAEAGQYGSQQYEGEGFGGSFGAKAVRLGMHSNTEHMTSGH